MKHILECCNPPTHWLDGALYLMAAAAAAAVM
jgi:hypothetical protein